MTDKYLFLFGANPSLEEACALFKNGKLESEFGEYVHHIEIDDKKFPCYNNGTR